MSGDPSSDWVSKPWVAESEAEAVLFDRANMLGHGPYERQRHPQASYSIISCLRCGLATTHPTRLGGAPWNDKAALFNHLCPGPGKVSMAGRIARRELV